MSTDDSTEETNEVVKDIINDFESSIFNSGTRFRNEDGEEIVVVGVEVFLSEDQSDSFATIKMDNSIDMRRTLVEAEHTSEDELFDFLKEEVDLRSRGKVGVVRCNLNIAEWEFESIQQ